MHAQVSRDVKPSEMIFELRSALVEEGEIPLTIQKALENTYVQKNPWVVQSPKGAHGRKRQA